MNALVYCRVSTTNQAEEGSSLESQLAACRAYASEHGYRIDGIYSDVVSGSIYRERPALSELRNQVRAGGIDIVLCYALDRLSRDQIHVAVLIDEIEHNDARLELVTEAFDDTPTGRLLRSVQSFVAEMEREKITERTSRGKLARVQSGKLLPGPKPLYGCQLNGDRDRYLIDPETAPIVERIYREYVNGSPLRTLGRTLWNEWGIPTPTGKQKEWPLSTLRQMLSDPRYTGKATAWSGTVELPEGTMPQIVDSATWQRAQQRLATGRARSQRNNHHYGIGLLRGGIGRCGLCGAGLVMMRFPRDGTFEYQCGRRSIGCRKFNMKVHLLDMVVLDELRAIFLDEGRIRRQAERELQNDDAGHLRALRSRRAALEKQQAALSDAIALAADADAITTLVTRLEAVSAQLRALSDEQRVVDMEAGQAEQRRRELRQILDQRDVVADRFDELTYHERREMLDSLQVTVHLWPSDRTPRWEIRSPLLDAIVFS